MKKRNNKKLRKKSSQTKAMNSEPSALRTYASLS